MYTKQNQSHRSKHDGYSQSCLQGFYIGILNKFYDIRIQKPHQPKIKSNPFLTILSIDKGDDEIFLSDHIEHRCNELFNLDILHGQQLSISERRLQKNRIKETLVFLLDAVEMNNYCFKSSNEQEKDDNIVYIKDYFTSKEITKIGKDIICFICDNFTTDDDIVIEKNDCCIQNILKL